MRSLLALLLVPCIVANAASRLEMRYEQQRLSANIESVPLEQVLARLQQTTGLVTNWIDPTTAAMPVSIRFTNWPLEKALRGILTEVSYTYYADRKRKIVHVLASAASREYLVHNGLASPPRTAPLVVDTAAAAVSAETNVPPAVIDAVSLDDPLANARRGLFDSDQAVQTDAVQQLAAMARETGELQAIQELKGAAFGTHGGSRQTSIAAARALAEQALGDGAGKEAAFGALRQLSRNNNSSVREVAKSTLAQLKAQGLN